jgi:tape measure domain-containing protein
MADETVVAQLDVKADASQAQQQLNQLASAIDKLNAHMGATKNASAQLASGQREVASATTSATGSIDAQKEQLNSFTSSITSAVVQFAALTAGVASFKSSAIDFNSTLQQSQVAFEVMTGSSITAQQHIQALVDFAQATPFELPQVLEASKKLQAMGSDIKDVIPELQTLGNIAAGVGMEKFPNLILAFGQVQAKGRLMGEEIRQFTEAGVPVLDTLAKAYGTTTAQMQKWVEEGKVGFQSLRYALDELGNTKFGNLMEKQSHTLAGAVSNIKDNLNSLGARAFKPLFDALSEAANKFVDFLNNADIRKNADNLAEKIQGIIDKVKEIGTEASNSAPLVTALGVALAGLAAQSTISGLANIVSLLGRIGSAGAFIGAAATIAGVAVAGTEELSKRGMLPPPPGQGPDPYEKYRGKTPVTAPTQGDITAAVTRARGQEYADEMAQIAKANAEAESSFVPVRDGFDKMLEAAKRLDDKKVPDLLGGIGGAAKKAAEEGIDILLAKMLALRDAMPDIIAAVAGGDLAGAAQRLVELGKSNAEAVNEVLRIQDDLARKAEENQRKAEQAAKDAANQAKEARQAWLDYANTLTGQVAKAFDALLGASQRSAGVVANYIKTLGGAAGSAITSALNIPINATIYKKPDGEGGGEGGGYAGPPRATISEGGAEDFGARIAGLYSRLAIGLGAYKQGAPGEGAALGITSGFSGAAALAAQGKSLEEINAALSTASTSIADLGHWMGENLTGAAKDAAGSLMEAYQAALQMAAEANGDATKLAKLAEVTDNLSQAQKDLITQTKAAEEAKKQDIAQQKAAELKASQDITQANQVRLGITTPRGPGGFQGTAPGGRDEYGNVFTPGVQSVWTGKNWEMKFASAEEQYQSWYKIRFNLTRSEMELENANWKLHEETLTRAKQLEAENARMRQRASEAEGWRKREEEILMRGLNISSGQLYGAEGDMSVSQALRQTLDSLIGVLNRGINAYIEPNYAADKLGSALDRRSALLSGAGGFGPGVF